MKNLRTLGIILILCLPLFPISAYLCTFFMTRVYYSEAVVAVDHDDYALRFVPREVTAVIFTSDNLHSRSFLYPVIDELKLGEKWANGGVQLPREETYSRLLKMLDMRMAPRIPFRLMIGVYSTDPVEAATIANAIALHCDKSCRDAVNKWYGNDITKREKELANQEKIVEKAEVEVVRIRDSDNLIEPNPDVVMDEKSPAWQPLEVAEAQVAQLKAQLAELDKITPYELNNWLKLQNIADPTITKVIQLCENTIFEEGRLISSGTEENDPRLLALRKQEDMYRKQLNAAVESLNKTLSTRLAIAESSLGDLTKNYNLANGRHIETKEMSPDYMQALIVYTQERNKWEQMGNILATSKLVKDSETIPSWKILTKAEPAITPASPKVYSIVMKAFGIGFLLAVIGLTLIQKADVMTATLESGES